MPKSPGLDSFCGFKAGEMRKDRKIGDTEQVTTKPRTKFRKFDGVGLRYSKGGRLCEISTWESISASNGSAAAKKEFAALGYLSGGLTLIDGLFYVPAGEYVRIQQGSIVAHINYHSFWGKKTKMTNKELFDASFSAIKHSYSTKRRI